jgi:1-acyl-sn-glycerol-3-phosphate acyltransferase
LLKKSETEFIPAQEKGWFIFLFDLYTRSLFWRRFKNIWVNQRYQPGPESNTIYYLNHTSWWDGLIPLLLNRKLFRQNARAIMEDKQMREHGLFKKIGAFSVNLENPRSAVRSLRFAVESMKRENSSLFIYPEGKIYPFKTENIQFRDGLAWIANRVQDADVVPIGIYITTANFDKPELYIKIGKPVEFNSETDRSKLKSIFEANLERVLEQLEAQAHNESFRFDRM